MSNWPVHVRRIREEMRPMLALAVPLVVAEIGWMGMHVVDTMMVGRLPNSADAIGAVSVGGMFFFVVGIIGIGLLLGLDTLISQAYGAGRIAECRAWLVNGTVFALALGPLLVLLLRLADPLMAHSHIQATVVSGARPFLRALSWSMIPLVLYIALRRYLQAIDRAHAVMFTLISANVVNAAGNWVLIYGHLGFPALGIVGSAWSTVIARAYMTAVMLAFIIHDARRRPVPGGWDLTPRLARMAEVVRLGVPAAGQFIAEVAVFATTTWLIARLSPQSLAAHEIALNTASFTYMVPLGVSAAAAVRVGHALGRRDPDGAADAGWAALLLGAGFMSCAAVALFCVPRVIARIFTPDPGVIDVAASLLIIAGFFQLFDGLQTVATGALRGAGDTRTPMLVHTATYWGVGLPVGYFLCFHRGWGAQGLWTGLSLALVLIGTMLAVAWRRRVAGFRTTAAAAE